MDKVRWVLQERKGEASIELISTSGMSSMSQYVNNPDHLEEFYGQQILPFSWQTNETKSLKILNRYDYWVLIDLFVLYCILGVQLCSM